MKGKLVQAGRYLEGLGGRGDPRGKGLVVKDRKGGKSVEQGFEGDGRDSKHRQRGRRKISENTEMS